VRIVNNDADDVLQAAYVNAYRAFDSFRSDAKFETWMYRIVYNACIDHRRRRMPTVGLSDDIASSEDVSTAVVQRADLAACLETLTVEQRAAVMLVDAEGFTFSDAAEVLDLPVGTVASRVSRARTQLRAQLGDHP
ncbi:MAG: sigma-70 family RNA polymerase sigma factor, partial [Actinobacteria bacterium]|nr:sigma-70 family RNA polymerase sigma factor [Actinomycetota bacterium]